MALFYAAAVLALAAGWLVWVSRSYHALRPPGPTLGDLLGTLPEPKDPEVFAYHGREYLVVCGPFRLFPRVPSGPTVYVFDDAGQLVGWTPDIGDDTGFLSQWTPKDGHRTATRAEVMGWPRGNP
jgi:hypothetical protein